MASGTTAAARLGGLEREQARHDERLKAVEQDIAELGDAIKSLRNAVLTFSFTVAGSAIAVLLALAQVAI